MPLTIIPLPLFRNGKLRVDANGETEDSYDEERYTDA